MMKKHQEADKILERKEKQIIRFYKTQEKTIIKLLTDFYKKHKDDFDMKLKEYNEGIISKEEYKKYMIDNTILSKEWRTIADKMADTLSAINQKALNSIVDKDLEKIYIENHNMAIKLIGGDLLEHKL